MKREWLHLFICPECRGGDLRLESLSEEGGEVVEGRVTCVCGLWFRIEEGVLDLLPLKLRRHDFYADFAGRHGLPWKQSSERWKKPEGVLPDVDDYERRVVNSPYYRALDRIMFDNWISRQRQVRPDGIILDIGCGTGRQCIPLASQGLRVLGMDVSEEMTRLARRKIRERKLDSRVEIIVGDGERPPVLDNAFDACVLYGVLHHLQDPGTAVCQSATKLLDGGRFFSLDPHRSPVRFLFDSMMRVWQLWVEEASDDPLLTEEKLRKWLAAAGLQGQTRLSTYVPPHAFMLTGVGFNAWALKSLDRLLGSVPGVRKLGGVIICEAQKPAGTDR